MTAAITDFNQFTSLRARAEQNDPAVLLEAASQFEALFIQTMLKNMRDTALADPIFGQSDQHEMYQDLMDQQLSMEMASGRGIGLAAMLVRQLGGEAAKAPVTPSAFALSPMLASGSVTSLPAAPTGYASSPVHSAGSVATIPEWDSPTEFVWHIWPHAERAAKELNVSPQAILAHAALETGWGEHVMSRPDGASSFNLFGIKASNDWRGDGVTKTTLEYSGGIANHETARFRTYADIGATFKDYVDFIGKDPRYQSVRNRGGDVEGFANALQQSGYATDPNYAKKITRVAKSGTMRDALHELKTSASPPINRQHVPVKVY